MKSFAPEFAQHWVAGHAESKDEAHSVRDEDVLSPSQEKALEALAERVNAARCTV